MVQMGGDAGTAVAAGEEDRYMCEHRRPFNDCKKCQPPLIGIVCVCLCVYDVGVCACVCVCVCACVCVASKQLRVLESRLNFFASIQTACMRCFRGTSESKRSVSCLVLHLRMGMRATGPDDKLNLEQLTNLLAEFYPIDNLEVRLKSHLSWLCRGLAHVFSGAFGASTPSFFPRRSIRHSVRVRVCLRCVFGYLCVCPCASKRQRLL